MGASIWPPPEAPEELQRRRGLPSNLHMTPHSPEDADSALRESDSAHASDSTHRPSGIHSGSGSSYQGAGPAQHASDSAQPGSGQGHSGAGPAHSDQPRGERSGTGDWQAESEGGGGGGVAMRRQDSSVSGESRTCLR